LFINAVNDVKRESAFSYLTDDHIQKIYQAFLDFKDNDSFSKVMPMKAVLANSGNMAVSLYIQVKESGKLNNKGVTLDILLNDWQKSSAALRMNLTKMINDLSAEIK